MFLKLKKNKNDPILLWKENFVESWSLRGIDQVSLREWSNGHKERDVGQQKISVLKARLDGLKNAEGSKVQRES